MGHYKGYGSPVTSWIIYSLAVVVPVVMSQPVLTSSVEQICLGDTIVFTCTTNESSTITWMSEEYIGPGSQQLQLRSIDPIGTIRRSTSNPDTVANLTAINTNGPTILMSTLHIKTRSTTSNVSVSCISANGRMFTRMIPLAVVPGAPQNVKAAEVSERIDRNCVILVTWDPPSNTDESDIDRYIINVPSRGIVDNVSSAITVLRIQNCRSDDIIQVTAVNRFGCVGQNSSEIQPSLLDDSAKTPVSTTLTPIGSTSESASVIAAATIAPLFVITIVLLVLLACAWFFMQHRKRSQGKKTQDTEKDVSANLPFVHLIEHNLQKLYKAMKSENDSLIQVAAKALSRTLWEESSTKYMKEALHNFLEHVQTEDIKQCQKALNKMDNIITGMRGLELNTEFKETVRQLRTSSGKKFKEVLAKFTQNMDAEEVNSENIIGILLTLCEKLQYIQQVKDFYQNQSKYDYNDLGTEDDRVSVPIWINDKLDITWKDSLHEAVEAINEAAPGLSLSVSDSESDKKRAIIHILGTDKKEAYTVGNILMRSIAGKSDFITKICLGKWEDSRKNGISIHELLHALGFHHDHQCSDAQSYEYPLNSGKKLTINQNWLCLIRFDSSSTTLYPCEKNECKEHIYSKDPVFIWLLKTDPIQQNNINLDELDMVGLNLVYPPCRDLDTASDNARYRPTQSKNGMYYCNRHVKRSRTYPGDEFASICGPDNGPNCPACRTIKCPKVEKILEGGRWQGMTGMVYCGRPFAKPARIHPRHDGMCGSNNGPACPECEHILNEEM